MSFTKTGDAEILKIITEGDDLNDEQTKTALDKVTKNLSEKTDELKKDSESN